MDVALGAPDDPAVPWTPGQRVSLTRAVTSRPRRRRCECFASQLERGDGPPLLTPEVVARQMAVGEIVFV